MLEKGAVVILEAVCKIAKHTGEHLSFVEDTPKPPHPPAPSPKRGEGEQDPNLGEGFRLRRERSVER